MRWTRQSLRVSRLPRALRDTHGFVCQPGTLVKLEAGLQHRCQSSNARVCGRLLSSEPNPREGGLLEISGPSEPLIKIKTSRDREREKAILRGGLPMPKALGLVCFLATLLVMATATTSDAKVLRNKNNTPTVWVFKDADALRRFGKVANAAVYDEAVIAPLLACKVPQGSKVVVLSGGYRTAYVRIVEGSAQGCEGTVPIARLQDE